MNVKCVIKKPQLTKNIDIKTFLDYYWLKIELIQFCRIYKNLTLSIDFPFDCEKCQLEMGVMIS
ncbi:MAG: SAP domain-containing protein [Silvanigrellaceae bacterium]|jgi:hypothetical protein|nr:SAP domain-containing protein [Silvanigrellaceae bacterium]